MNPPALGPPGVYQRWFRRRQPCSQRSTKPPAASVPRQRMTVSKSTPADTAIRAGPPPPPPPPPPHPPPPPRPPPPPPPPPPGRNRLKDGPGLRVEDVPGQHRAEAQAGKVILAERQVPDHVAGAGDAFRAPLPDDLVAPGRSR
jgi:hypothetical protein